ncbi:MAG TPA: RidA family protein [Steroidobacteraceae bacterium]|jgi:2-iminobutanoate/2-iminopropanoate deaminase|nr:RidA family protein [Steroidobacteraceae bacterium]
MSRGCRLKRYNRHLLIAVLTLAVEAPLASGAEPGPPDRSYIEHVFPPGSAAAPFSDAVRTGDTLYVAGHLGLDPATGKPPADPQAEVRLVMDALKRTLERAGFSMDDLVSVTVYCTDLGLYDTFNTAYARYFQGPHPSRAFIGVSSLIRSARFEVQGVAMKRARKTVSATGNAPPGRS